MSAYQDCKWCYGNGCNQCNIERRKAQERFEKEGPKPIFSAKTDNPEDMQLLKDVFGKDALEHAFGPDGGGVQEIEKNAAIASLKQCMRNANENTGGQE